MYIYIYYVFIDIYVIHLYIYICMCICVYVYMYMWPWVSNNIFPQPPPSKYESGCRSVFEHESMAPLRFINHVSSSKFKHSLCCSLDKHLVCHFYR